MRKMYCVQLAQNKILGHSPMRLTGEVKEVLFHPFFGWGGGEHNNHVHWAVLINILLDGLFFGYQPKM